jgi:hypothetical protein
MEMQKAKNIQVNPEEEKQGWEKLLPPDYKDIEILVSE